MDKDTEAALKSLAAHTQEQIALLRFAQMATRIAVLAIARTHPNPAALAAEFHLETEHAIADVLTKGYPEHLAARYTKEFEDLRDYLNAVAQATNQRNGE